MGYWRQQTPDAHELDSKKTRIVNSDTLHLTLSFERWRLECPERERDLLLVTWVALVLCWWSEPRACPESVWALRLMDSSLCCAQSPWLAPGSVERWTSRDYPEARFGQLRGWASPHSLKSQVLFSTVVCSQPRSLACGRIEWLGSDSRTEAYFMFVGKGRVRFIQLFCKIQFISHNLNPVNLTVLVRVRSGFPLLLHGANIVPFTRLSPRVRHFGSWPCYSS